MGFKFRQEADAVSDHRPRNVIQITASQSSVLDAEGVVQHDRQLYALADDGSVWWYHFEPTYGPYWRRLEEIPGGHDPSGDPRFNRFGRLSGPDDE